MLSNSDTAVCPSCVPTALTAVQHIIQCHYGTRAPRNTLLKSNQLRLKSSESRQRPPECPPVIAAHVGEASAGYTPLCAYSNRAVQCAEHV